MSRDMKLSVAFVGIQEALQGLDPIERTTVLLTAAAYQLCDDGIPLDIAKATAGAVFHKAYEEATHADE
jgi:hypothetical protein